MAEADVKSAQKASLSGYRDEADAKKYLDSLEKWYYESKEMGVDDCPDWFRQMGYPCLPPENSPGGQAPEVGKNPQWYLDAFYYRCIALAAPVVDLSAITGDVVWVGCGMGGGLPLFREYLPNIRSFTGVEILPWHVDVGLSRDIQGEIVQGDVMKLSEDYSGLAMVVDDAVVSQYRFTCNDFGHLFEPAMRQIHAALAPGGLYLPNSSLKLSAGQNVSTQIEKIEALGFKCLASEDCGAACLEACDRMEEHCFGPNGWPELNGAITEEDKERYPMAVSNMYEEYIRYYRKQVSRGKKTIGCFVFQKI